MINYIYNIKISYGKYILYLQLFYFFYFQVSTECGHFALHGSKGHSASLPGFYIDCNCWSVERSVVYEGNGQLVSFHKDCKSYCWSVEFNR